MSVLFIDCETYSDLDLKEVGSYVYAKHPYTEVILWSVRELSWARPLVFEEQSIWWVLLKLKAAGQIDWTQKKALYLVHWGAFDRLIAQHGPAVPQHGVTRGKDTWDDDEPWSSAISGPRNTYWCDLREISQSFGGPGKLKHAAAFYGGLELKDEGKHLISKFCKPNRGNRTLPEDEPVRWQQFKGYAGQDVECMVPIWQQLNSLEGGHRHWEHWEELRVVGRMNERGAPIDVESVQKTIEAMAVHEQELSDDCQERYGFRPTQVAKVKEFLGTPDTRRETLEEYLSVLAFDSDQVWVAEARLALAGAARKKLQPMLAMADPVDHRVRGCFDYHGAWTRRLTSFGVQFQNMVREPSDETFFNKLEQVDNNFELGENLFEQVRNNIRGYIKAPEGRVFVAADYNAIECRVAAWLANESWLLDDFVEGRDPYLRMASEIYGEPVTEKKDPRRQFGKVVELGAGYQLGGQGLLNQCAQQGIELTLNDAKEVIEVYRRLHPRIVRHWGDLQDAFEDMVRSGSGAKTMVGKIILERHPLFVKVIRPSDFAQYYWMPQQVEGEWPDGSARWEIQYVGRGKNGAMTTKHTYGGDIFQGVVQGAAADLMLYGMLNAERRGLEPILSVHDEVVCEVDAAGGERMGKELCLALCERPDWAEGLPLVAEGWIDGRFTKG